MIARIRRFIAGVLVISLALPLPSQAGMLATDAALGAGQRDHINRLLDRADVQARLEAYGVKADDVRARVAALTDDEVAALADRIDNLPAGGVSIIGALVLIFVILLHHRHPGLHEDLPVHQADPVAKPQAAMPNRLARETSPYLQQHADNPVDWYPWGPEALERARREDKLPSVRRRNC
jgi:Family of unknown function (DUF6627)/Protein of unknown function, DUF255